MFIFYLQQRCQSLEGRMGSSGAMDCDDFSRDGGNSHGLHANIVKYHGLNCHWLDASGLHCYGLDTIRMDFNRLDTSGSDFHRLDIRSLDGNDGYRSNGPGSTGSAEQLADIDCVRVTSRIILGGVHCDTLGSSR